MMRQVDRVCSHKAIAKINEEMLDISHICNQNRENQWLKETILSKIELKILNENYRKVINPFKDQDVRT